jgi:hypothetical protein
VFRWVLESHFIALEFIIVNVYYFGQTAFTWLFFAFHFNSVIFKYHLIIISLDRSKLENSTVVQFILHVLDLSWHLTILPKVDRTLLIAFSAQTLPIISLLFKSPTFIAIRTRFINNYNWLLNNLFISCLFSILWFFTRQSQYSLYFAFPVFNIFST